MAIEIQITDADDDGTWSESVDFGDLIRFEADLIMIGYTIVV